MPDPLLAGIAAQIEMLDAGEISSVELTKMSLRRIDDLGPALNAFRIVLAEQALTVAAEADRRRAAGEGAPLLGVPIAVKDNVDVAGELTTNGTRAFPDPAAADDEYFRRIRAAGAVLVGKTTCPELSIFGFTETDAHGITRNPWDPGRTPGGSSGGSAAAVAAGMVGVASASDGAGSIRIPASNCGLFGLKPQRGRVSLAPARSHWHGMSQLGCLTRRVEDTAIWLDATQGWLPGDRHKPPAPASSYVGAAARDPGRLRIALTLERPRSIFPQRLDPRVAAAVDATADVLRGLGHEVVERTPDYGMVSTDYITCYLAGIAEDYRATPRPELLERRTRGMGRLGSALPAAAVRRAIASMGRHAARINAIFDEVDLVLSPVAAEPPIEIGRWAGRGALRTLIPMGQTYPYAVVWNYTGQPAVSVPAPVAEGELPIGAMLVSPPNREDLLLSISAQLERETAWPERLPSILNPGEFAGPAGGGRRRRSDQGGS